MHGTRKTHITPFFYWSSSLFPRVVSLLRKSPWVVCGPRGRLVSAHSREQPAPALTEEVGKGSLSPPGT